MIEQVSFAEILAKLMASTQLRKGPVLLRGGRPMTQWRFKTTIDTDLCLLHFGP
jgi:hypothetical protein